MSCIMCCEFDFTLVSKLKGNLEMLQMNLCTTLPYFYVEETSCKAGYFDLCDE